MNNITPQLDPNQHRRQQLLSQVDNKEGILVTKPSDITYFFGFSEFLEPHEREAIGLIHNDFSVLFIPPLTVLPSLGEVQIIQSTNVATLTSQLGGDFSAAVQHRLWVDYQSLLASELVSLQQYFSTKLQALNRSQIWNLRTKKDQTEIQNLKKAGIITAKSFSAVMSQLAEGMTERQVAQQLDTTMFHLGSERPAFPTIVAFGNHTALPHYQAGPTKLKQEMPVLIDFGATVGGYRSDMTRTIWFGKKPSKEFLHLEKTVLRAYQASIDLLRKRGGGVTAAQIDRAAREVIEQAGYGRQFIHTTGHGLGLDIHEPPSLNSQNSTLLQPGMAITIEPGIYLPNKLGYRHENTVVIESKHRVNEITSVDRTGIEPVTSPMRRVRSTN